METVELNVEEQELGKRTLLEGEVEKIIVNKYYDLDGDIIQEGQDTFEYRYGAQFKITATKRKMFDYEYEWWMIEVNGLNLGREWELTSYNFDRKNKQLILKGCTGAG